MNRRPILFRHHALAAAVVLSLAGAAQAQTSNALLRGSVTGASPANAEVQAVNTANGYTWRTRAGADGSYVIAGLPPGTYKVTVTGSDGKKTETTVTLQVGQAADLDLALAGSPAPQQITIVGAAIREKKTSEVGTYVTPQQLQRLPQVTRNFLSQADLAPGVNVEYDKDGNVKLRAGPTARSAINVFIDGVSQKDYVLRGGVTGQDNSRGNPFPQSALAEYKVITQNYKAEYDQVGSAAVTAVTKSGTNQFKGDAFYDRTQASWRAATPEEAKAGKKVDSSQDQYGASVGGPIVMDKVHFFAALEGKRNRDPKSVTAGGPSNAAALLPASAQGLLGPVKSPFDETLIFAKVDFSISDEQRLDLNIKVRNEKDRKHLGDQESADFSANNKVEEKRFWARHQYAAAGFTNEATLTYEDSFFSQDPVNPGNGVRYRFVSPNGSTLNETTVLEAGGSNFYQRKGQKGFGLQDDLTFNAFNWNGSHVVKTGVKYKHIKVSAIEQFNPTPQFYYALNGNTPNIPYKVEFGAPLAGVGNGGTETTNSQLGVYVQDDWDLSKALQVNLGLRYDYERSPTYLNHVTPADVIAALNVVNPNDTTKTYAQTLAQGGVNINDYISDGSKRKAFTKAIQPRVGFSLDLSGNKQTVLFGGWGRSYDRNIFDIIQLEKTKGTFPNYSIGFSGPQLGTAPYCAAGPTCVAYNANFQNRSALVAQFASGSGREIDLLKNDLKVPYSDQLSLGIRYSVAGWETEATLSHIVSKDGFVFLLGNRRPGGLFYEAGQSSGPPWGFGVPGQGGLILGTNGVESKATSLFLRADKPYTKASGWGTTLSYTYSDAKENHNSQDDFTYLLDYPTPAGSPMLRASTVSKHKLVATGTYDAPWETVVSGKLTLASPLTIRDFNCSSSGCFADLAYKRVTRLVDVSVMKSIDIGLGMKLSLRADVINLFNYKNWDGFNVNWGNPTTTVPNGTISTPPRTLKLGIGASW